MRPMVKALLDQIKGIELWLAAFPLIRCLIEGHAKKPLPKRSSGNDVEPPIHFCERCKLVFWE